MTRSASPLADRAATSSALNMEYCLVWPAGARLTGFSGQRRAASPATKSRHWSATATTMASMSGWAAKAARL